MTVFINAKMAFVEAVEPHQHSWWTWQGPVKSAIKLITDISGRDGIALGNTRQTTVRGQWQSFLKSGFWQHWISHQHQIPNSKWSSCGKGKEEKVLLQKHSVLLDTSDYDSQTVARSDKLLKLLYNRHLQLILSLNFPNVGCVPFSQAYSVSILFLALNES